MLMNILNHLNLISDGLEFFTNARGQTSVLDSTTGQRFHKHGAKNSKVFWKCWRYKKLRCPAIVTTEGNNFVKYLSEHNHE